MDWPLESAVQGLAWPSITPPHGSAKLALLHQLEQSEWLPAERLRELQLVQLEVLLRHTVATVPHYRNRLGKDASAKDLSDLPVLAMRDLQEGFAELRSEAVPREHGNVGEVRTSGSTGTPKRVLKTQLCQLFWEVLTLREHAWHKRTLGAKLAAIRRGSKGTQPSWGAAMAGVARTGPAVGLPVETDIEAQLAWLREQNPGYLLTYPSVLGELARLSISQRIRLPGLVQARTLSEIVTPELRQLCREAWNVPVADLYSAEEVGYIALQCPEHEHYHAQAEALLVEILDERGRACAPGEVGRVVVTDLHNFAMPLIRYDIGDFAKVGPPCPCGRGLPVLARIIGRTRNLLVTADGKRHYPFIGQSQYLDIAPILQHQLVQTAFDLIEARLVTREPLTKEQIERFQAHVVKQMPAGIRIEVVRVDSIPRSAGGKYEDFISLVEH